jgi:hypothetical protein
MNRSRDPMNAIARVQDKSIEIKLSADARIPTQDLQI